SACTSVTMPATWEATSTPCEENSVPMEVSCSTHFSVRAGSDVTVDGGGTFAVMKPLIMSGFQTKFHMASTPTKMAARTPVTMKRMVIGGLRCSEGALGLRDLGTGGALRSRGER